MKKIITICVFLVACAEARTEAHVQEDQKNDVIYTFKKEFHCVDIPESITQSVKFNPQSGHFFVDNEVTPSHKECSFVDIAVCGTMTEKK